MAQDAHLGRLNFRTVFDDFTQVFGDAVETSGAVASFGDPKPSPITVNFPIEEDTVVASQKLRRQVFGLLGNRAARAYLWFGFDQDPESSCWLMVGGGEIQVLDGASTFARWKLVTSDTYVIGRPSRYRPAKRLYLTDLRNAAAPRDYFQSVYSTDFATIVPLAVHYLPFGATDVQGVGRSVPVVGSRASKAGAVPVLVGRSDQEIVSYEQTPASRHNDSDVRIYDRRALGTLSQPTTGPDPLWEEVYGPDQPLGTVANDAPVLDNGICRARMDDMFSNHGLWNIDLWSGSAWVEQGAAFFVRRGDSTLFLDTVVASSVLEYTPDRAVVSVVARASSDSLSREQIIVTLQRGWTGPRFELYVSPKSGGVKSDGEVNFTVISAATNDSLLKIDTAGGVVVTTAGSGSVNFPTAMVGTDGTFTGENWVSMLRQVASPYQITMATVQYQANAIASSSTTAYVSPRNNMIMRSVSNRGYVSAHLGFTPQDANQVMEAESMTLGSGTTSVADAAASSGNKAQATRTADAIHMSKNPWVTGANANNHYRVLALVKTSASTLNLYAKTGASTGATKTTTSTGFVWVDLGNIIADGGVLEIHAWATAAATFAVDRIEAWKLSGLTTPRAYDGARDTGQSALYDAGQVPALQER